MIQILQRTGVKLLVTLLVALWVSLGLPYGGKSLALASSIRHPMDALTRSEYEATVSILKAANLVDQNSRYSFITLHEPPKVEMLKWQPGQPFSRSALAVIKQGPLVYEAVVDLTNRQVTSWEAIEAVQAGILLEEWVQAQEITTADAGWLEAVQKRGITQFDQVVCIPLSAGYFNIPEEEGHRLFRVSCFDSQGTKNFWGRPIEGVTAIVDIDQGKVVKLSDTGVMPMPTSPVDFDAASVRKLLGKLRPKPTALQWVEHGHGFKLDGQVVNWQNWQFHFRLDPRVGPVVSMVRYNDQGHWRSVMYEGSLSELFVPYMSPKDGWYFRTYMDAGEYGAGKLAVPLVHDRDCPSTAVYFDAVFADGSGQPYIQPDATCLFERYAGDILWRHYEGISGNNESRRNRELVLRFITAIGNYDYQFDWVFGQNGSIGVRFGASGIEQVEAVAAASLEDTADTQATDYGHLVSPHTVAVNHDHFFNFRLDLDVDGLENSFVYDKLKVASIAEQSPRTSIWTIDSHTAATESEAKQKINITQPALWRVINPHVTNAVGYPTGYELKYKANAVSLLAPDDYPQKRAGFTDYHLWVTPYDPKELYAGGDYPNQSHGGDGLPLWTSHDRSIQNTDIVLWYTLGHHHVVRTEDWPVLPTDLSEFELRPFDFFDRNPAIDIPEEA